MQRDPDIQIEVERKYHFSDEGVFKKIEALLPCIETDLGYECDVLDGMRQVDAYYDTDNRDLERGDCILRIRRTGDMCEITIKKPIMESNMGQSERFEIQRNIDVDSLDGNEGFIGSHLDFIDPASLKRTLTVENNRLPVNLVKGDVRFEMVFDKVTYIMDGHIARDCQLEIELKSDHSHKANLKEITEYLEREMPELTVSRDSKYKRGLRMIQEAFEVDSC